MHENKYNHYRIPAGLLIVFLEKALTLIHMETHLNDVRILTGPKWPFIAAERGNQNVLASFYIAEPPLLRQQRGFQGESPDRTRVAPWDGLINKPYYPK